MRQSKQELIEHNMLLYNNRKEEVCEFLSPEEIELLNSAEKIVTDVFANNLNPFNMDQEQVMSYNAAFQYLVDQLEYRFASYLFMALMKTYE